MLVNYKYTQYAIFFPKIILHDIMYFSTFQNYNFHVTEKSWGTVSPNVTFNNVYTFKKMNEDSWQL